MKKTFFKIVCIFSVCTISFCEKPKNDPATTADSVQANKNGSSASENLEITDQAEGLYRSVMQSSGNRIMVFPAGSYDLQQVDAPATFGELALRLQNGWTVPSQDFSHPVMQFLVALHKKSPLRFNDSVILHHNLKSYFLAYSFITRECNTESILNNLKKNLQSGFSYYLNDPDLSITWSGSLRTLILSSKNKQKIIIVKPLKSGPLYREQKIKQVTFTSDEIKLLRKEFRGSAQLMDNALGKIREFFVFYNRHLPYKTLLSICRAIDARINIITLPQSMLIHYIDSYIQSITEGNYDRSYLENIIETKSHSTSRYKDRIETLCREDSAVRLHEDSIVYVNRLKKLREDIFGEEIEPHQKNLSRQLRSDGIAPDKFIIIPSQNLETRWARDYFLVGLTKKQKPLLLESSIQIIRKNKILAEELSRSPALKNTWEIQDIHLPFEGGDIRAVGQYLFMGENTFEAGIEEILRIIRSTGKARIGSDSGISTDRTSIALLLKKEYESLSGREFVLVGEGDNIPQAMMHIDMFLTFLPNPGKKPTVVVADIREALTLLQGLSKKDFFPIESAMLRASLDPVELGQSSRFWLYRGIFMRHDLFQIMEHGGLHRYLSTLQQSAYRIELQQRLDAIAAWFTQRGYPVVRAPSAAPPLCYMNYWSRHNGVAILETIQDNAQRVYNNVLVEMYIDNKDTLHRTVYMPCYGIVPVEKRLVEIYNDLGYRVVFVPYMWEPAYGRGALDCLTSEIRRAFKE
jgi:hypothetical protein